MFSINPALISKCIILMQYIIPVVALVAISSAYDWIVFILLVLLILVALTYVMVGGCILSVLQQNLGENDFTVYDPFIKLFGLKKNDKNRRRVSSTLLLLYLAIVYYIYKSRYGLTLQPMKTVVVKLVHILDRILKGTQTKQ